MVLHRGLFLFRLEFYPHFASHKPKTSFTLDRGSLDTYEEQDISCFAALVSAEAPSLCCCSTLSAFNGNQGHLNRRAQQTLTHAGSPLLRVVAQRSRASGESSSSLHSSGAAVSVGPFPSSQMYRATCNRVNEHVKEESSRHRLQLWTHQMGFCTFSFVVVGLKGPQRAVNI